jgi:hypothetical protein
MLVRRVNRDAAADDHVGELFELTGPLPNRSFDRVGLVRIVKNDFQWYLHLNLAPSLQRHVLCFTPLLFMILPARHGPMIVDNSAALEVGLMRIHLSVATYIQTRLRHQAVETMTPKGPKSTSSRTRSRRHPRQTRAGSARGHRAKSFRMAYGMRGCRE